MRLLELYFLSLKDFQFFFVSVSLLCNYFIYVFYYLFKFSKLDIYDVSKNVCEFVEVRDRFI